jgi:hypothetical protein
MHALSHSLVHRAPLATRTRVRWQPDRALPQNMPLRSPQVSYLNTPASSTASSPASTASLSEIDRPMQPPPPPSQVPRENQPHDAQKNKYMLGLVSQFTFSLQHPQFFAIAIQNNLAYS